MFSAAICTARINVTHILIYQDLVWTKITRTFKVTQKICQEEATAWKKENPSFSPEPRSLVYVET
jgi:hypothetical protein